MQIGFSSLALFMYKLEDMLKIAIRDRFDSIEILCEGPYWPRNLLKNENKKYIEVFDSYDIEIMLHAPTIDLNPASMNEGIRKETKKQTIEALDFAEKIGATAITTHPGVIHRRENRIRNLAIDYTIDTLKDCQKHGEEIGVIFSVENMPNKFSFLGNSPEEHAQIVNNIESNSTIDWGHANTCKNPEKFLNAPNISYFHLNDNEGIKDQHLPLGKGTVDFSSEFLKKVKKGIIELNSYENVLKSKEFLSSKFI